MGTPHLPGTAPTCADFRSELRTDLASLADIPSQRRDDIELCASEAFANAVTHSRSGLPGGNVIRLLSTPLVMGRKTTLRLCVIDDGPLPHHPTVPSPRRSIEDWETTESGRGLALVHHLADEWGTCPCPFSERPERSGTVLWAEFTYLTRPAYACGGVR